LARSAFEKVGGGVLRDAYGRREIVLVDRDAPLASTDIQAAGAVFDADGREQVVLSSTSSASALGGGSTPSPWPTGGPPAGAPSYITSSVPGTWDSSLSLYVPSNASFAKFGAALAGARAGTAPCLIHFYGDSVTWGSGTSGPYYATSYAAKTRAQLVATDPAYAEGVVWALQTPSNDSRITLGTNWSQGGLGIVNNVIWSVNPGTSTPLTWTPNYSVDTFKVYYRRAGITGNMDLWSDSGSHTTVNTNGAEAALSTTISAGTLGTHTLSIQPTTTADRVHVFAIEAYNSATVASQIRVSRAGVFGAKTGDWLDDTQPYQSLKQAFDMVVPDLTVLYLGINDAANSVPSATTIANLTTIINRAKGVNSDVLLVNYQPIDIPRQTGQDAALWTLADTLNVSLVDLNHHWEENYTKYSSPPYSYTAGGHPTDAGATDIGSLFARVIRQLGG
jgi:lysophospholipase L1-like esterase